MLTLALLLAATPISLKVELSRPTQERAGAHLEQVLRERLEQEGFVFASPPKVRLVVEELHGVVRLSAQPEYGELLTREFKPTGDEWSDELALEFAQRLAFLAHEAEQLPTPQKVLHAEVTTPEPEPEPQPEPTPPPTDEYGLHVAAGVRAGVAFRFPQVDPAFSLFGALALGVVEPFAAVSFVIAPGSELLAFEVPLHAGLRVPLTISAWRLVFDAGLGTRLHFYGPSVLDAGGLRADFLGVGGISLTRLFGSLHLGLRVGVELSASREHLAGASVLWSRGPASLVLQVVFERAPAARR